MGFGRMAAVRLRPVAGVMRNILVTAGPTREHLDDVRFLSNGSTGRMGYALAEAARDAGHRVHLVLGPVESAPPHGITVASVTSALEMQAAAESAFDHCDIAIATAAVADFRPRERRTGKPARTGATVTLELVPNPDIVAGLAARKGCRVVVGFALESSAAGMAAAVERARAKLVNKQLDLVVANLTDAIGAGASEAVIVRADGSAEHLGRIDKPALARRILDAAEALWQQKQLHNRVEQQVPARRGNGAS
jgi:phosphopantothenoylcysteine decarboxylase/phosphopantothenate--cysteine ligase